MYIQKLLPCEIVLIQILLSHVLLLQQSSILDCRKIAYSSVVCIESSLIAIHCPLVIDVVLKSSLLIRIVLLGLVLTASTLQVSFDHLLSLNVF